MGRYAPHVLARVGQWAALGEDELCGARRLTSLHASLVRRWCVSMHWEFRRRFEGILQASPELPLRRRFTRPAEVDAWVAQLEAEVEARKKAV